MKFKLLGLAILTTLGIMTTSCDPSDSDGNKVYDMSAIRFEDASYVYDGTQKKLEISGTLPKGVSVTYTDNTLTNAGSLEVIASFKGSSKYEPIPDMSAILTITKKDLSSSGIEFNDATYFYDGTVKKLEISGTLPQGVSVSYSSPGIIIGSVDVTATFTSSNYHLEPMTATLKVKLKTYSEGDDAFVDFGMYPQTVVTDYTLNANLSGRIANLNELGYVEFEGEAYKPFKSVMTEKFPSTQEYFSNRTLYFYKVEPIKWRILKSNSNDIFLLSEYVLDSQYYLDPDTERADGITKNNYEHSDIRHWLNDNFVKTAFIQELRDFILTSTIDNSGKDADVISETVIENPNASNNTLDKVSLLSYEEAIDADYEFNTLYNATDNKRKAGVTDFAVGSSTLAINTNFYDSLGIYTAHWYLRTPYSGNTDDNWSVQLEGALYHGDFTDYPRYGGIRPAITVPNI